MLLTAGLVLLFITIGKQLAAQQDSVIGRAEHPADGRGEPVSI